MDFYTDDDIILDPAFKNQESFLKHYDFDLLGKPIGLGRDFLRNPAGFLKTFVLKYKIELIFCPTVLFVLYFIYAIVRASTVGWLHAIKAIWKFATEDRKAHKERKLRDNQGLPPDYDLQAQAIYRTLTDINGVKSGTGKQLLARAADYEAARFALEAAWLSVPGLRCLEEADPLRSFEDEPIEGAEADEEMERMLEEMESSDEDEEEQEVVEDEPMENADDQVADDVYYEENDDEGFNRWNEGESADDVPFQGEWEGGMNAEPYDEDEDADDVRRNRGDEFLI